MVNFISTKGVTAGYRETKLGIRRWRTDLQTLAGTQWDGDRTTGNYRHDSGALAIVVPEMGKSFSELPLSPVFLSRNPLEKVLLTEDSHNLLISGHAYIVPQPVDTLCKANESAPQTAGARVMTNLPSDNKMAAKRSQANKPQAFRFDQKVHSNAAGWGKKAAERLSNKEQFKNDPLLKTLEGKIAMNYGDYQPWQRTTNPRHMEKEAPAKAPALSKIARGRPASSRMSNSARSLKGVRREDTLLSMAGGARPYSAATVHSTRTACSSVCAHPWIVKKPPPVDDADLRRRQNAISIMKVCFAPFSPHSNWSFRQRQWVNSPTCKGQFTNV